MRAEGRGEKLVPTHIAGKVASQATLDEIPSHLKISDSGIAFEMIISRRHYMLGRAKMQNNQQQVFAGGHPPNY